MIMKKKKKKTLIFTTAFVLLFSCLLSGCGIGTSETTKLRDLEFTIVSEERLPEELKSLIEERKATEFKVTYSDKEYLCKITPIWFLQLYLWQKFNVVT